MSNTDQALMQRICQRDTAALGELYDRYATRVYSLAVMILGDGMVAQEVTQDTFMKVWQSAAHFTYAEGRFVSWLLTITRRQSIDHIRHEQRRANIAASLDDDTLPELRDAAQEDEARWREMRHMLDELPVEQREVIILAYYRGLSQSEIAEHLGQPLGTVKTRLRLGMQKLRQTMPRQ